MSQTHAQVYYQTETEHSAHSTLYANVMALSFIIAQKKQYKHPLADKWMDKNEMNSQNEHYLAIKRNEAARCGKFMLVIPALKSLGGLP